MVGRASLPARVGGNLFSSLVNPRGNTRSAQGKPRQGQPLISRVLATLVEASNTSVGQFGQARIRCRAFMQQRRDGPRLTFVEARLDRHVIALCTRRVGKK